MMALYAKAGETVTCELGHRIARASRDLVMYEVMLTLGQFDWIVEEPMQGQIIPNCSCGAKWWRFGELHFEGGWR